jgi:hypothetical protein
LIAVIESKGRLDDVSASPLQAGGLDEAVNRMKKAAKKDGTF